MFLCFKRKFPSPLLSPGRRAALLCAFPGTEGWLSSTWQCVLEEAAAQQPTMAWLGEFSSKSSVCPKNSCSCACRGTCAISLIIVVMWSPCPALCQPEAAGWRSLQTCHASEPAGVLLGGQQTESTSRARVPANQLTSAFSETLRSFIREGEVASGHGVTSTSTTVPGRAHLVL